MADVRVQWSGGRIRVAARQRRPHRWATFRDSEPSGWKGAINVNLFGVLHCSRAVINGMCERGFGRVITISSGAGLTGLRIGVSPYAAGKGGAIAFMRHLAAENARDGVTANSLALGLMQPENSGPVDALAKQIPVGRTGTPEDIGSACVYLASDEASWVTGQTIHIDGGATFGRPFRFHCPVSNRGGC